MTGLSRPFDMQCYGVCRDDEKFCDADYFHLGDYYSRDPVRSLRLLRIGCLSSFRLSAIASSTITLLLDVLIVNMSQAGSRVSCSCHHGLCLRISLDFICLQVFSFMQVPVDFFDNLVTERDSRDLYQLVEIVLNYIDNFR